MVNKLKISLLIVLLSLFVAANAQRRRTGKKPQAKTGTAKQNQSARNKKANTNNASQTTITASAQAEALVLSQDTNKLNVVTVTSSFKPSLRTAAKINFTASAPELDTNRFTLNYSIPAQNLVFSYQPAPIKPLALTSDSDFTWQNHQYIKAGFGNYTTPYLETGLSFGHPNTTLYTINGKFVSSKGNLDYQQFTKADFKASAALASIANHDLLASVSYSLSAQNKYGVQKGIAFNKDSLQQNFNTITADISLHTKTENANGISYHPHLNASYFFDNNKATETSFIIQAPITKSFNQFVSFSVAVNADLSSYNADKLKLSNHIFSIAPTVKISMPDFRINAGVLPSWDNSLFAFLPNVSGEYNLAREKFIVTGGVLGYFIKNNYKNLAAINPFIEQPVSFTNTKVSEIYGGIKGALGSHFTFNGQLSFLKFSNLALFTNDSIAGKSQNFNILYEPHLNAVRIGGEIGYTDKEKFSLLSSVKYTQFTQQDSFPKAYGFIPLEINAAIRYKVLKDLFIKSDLSFFDGNYYRVQTIQTDKTKAAFDMSLGAEMKVQNRLNIFLDINNLFNNQYQRWNQYNVLGFNVVAGLVYSFR